jgi:glycosyltransferase involved in cell wall biosynthesis
VKIVAFAYACEPDKGSESGAGWALARVLAGLGETWVITRANNRDAIESALPDLPERDRLHFEYVDLPTWARFWKRGRIGIQPYYALWQFAALQRARRLHRETGFDIAWHVTMANAWIGSTAALLGPPFVYGPVGGAMGVPLRLLGMLGARGVVYELVRGIARAGGRYANPLARVSWRRARLILAQNRETVGWFPPAYRERAAVFPNTFLEWPAPPPRLPGPGRTAVYAGRLMPLKGLPLAVHAIAMSPGWRLVLYGEGTDEQRLRRLAGELGIAERVEFRGHVPREQLLRALREEADVFLFPSLRDDAGWAVVEAIGAGVPVACLDRGGPPLLAGDGVAVLDARRSARGLASKLEELRAGRVPQPPDLDLTARRVQLEALLRAHGLPVPERGAEGAAPRAFASGRRDARSLHAVRWVP